MSTILEKIASIESEVIIGMLTTLRLRNDRNSTLSMIANYLQLLTMLFDYDVDGSNAKKQGHCWTFGSIES